MLLLAPGVRAQAPAPAAAAPAGALSLYDCVSEALLNSPELSASRAAIAQARDEHRALNASALPPVGFSYSEIMQKKVMVPSLGNKVTQNPDMRIFEVNTQWALYSGGQLGASREIARLGEAAAQQRYAATTNGVISQTVQAYLALLRAQELKLVADHTVDLAKEQVKIATVSFNAGAVPKVNVLRAEAARQNALQSQLSAQNGIELSRAALLAAMGRRQGETVAVQSIVRRVADVPELLESLRKAVVQRPELRVQQDVILINKQNVKLAQAAKRPIIYGGGKYDHTIGTSTFGAEDNWQANMVLQLNLWDWGKASYNVAKAREQVVAERNKLERQMRDIELDVRRAVLSITDARQRVEAATAEVQASTEALKIEQLRYSVGEGIYLELLDARRTLSAAEANLVNAYYDSAQAEAAWLTSTGGFVAGGKLVLPAAAPATLPTGPVRPGKEFGDLLADYGVGRN